MAPMARSAKKRKIMPKKKRFTYSLPAKRSFIPIGPRAGPGNSCFSTFIYTTKGSINPGAVGAAAVYQFRLNSLFDPDLTGVGTQPIPHDQFAAVYERYLVYETSYKVVFATSNATTDCVVGVSLSDDATTTTDVDRIIQNGQADWDICNPRGGSRDVVTFKGTVDLAAAQGKTKAAYFADDLHEGQFGANPSEVYVLNLFGADISTGDPGVISFYIELRFKARLSGNVVTTTS